MISSAFALKEATIIPEYLVSNKETTLEQNYYFNDSLKFLLECEQDLLSCRQKFYRTVLEAGDDNIYLINESFEDILNDIKNIIKKMIAYVESIAKRFITSLAKFIGSDKYIMKMKKEISKFPKDESFTISGYTYTIDENIPIVDIVELDLAPLYHELEKIKDSDNIDAKITILKNIMDELCSDTKMDEIRAKILDVKTYKISETDFEKEVFSVFRDGKSDESDININREDVMKALNSYDGYSNKTKAVTRTRDKIKSKYRALENSIDTTIANKVNEIINSSSVSTQTKTSLKNSLDSILTSQVNNIRRISNEHIKAFAAKLDAYNALIVQDRNILYKALSVVNKDIKNMRIMESYECHDYTRDGEYKSFLLEKYSMNLRQQRFVEECLALSESNIPQLKIIQEDLKLDVKNKFEKLKKFIKDIFEKFMMKMNSFIMNEKKFLAKYKEIILTKKIPDEGNTFNNMPHYEDGIKNITTHIMKTIDIKSNLGKSELQIQQSLLEGYDGTGKFVDYAKGFFTSNNNKQAPRDVKPSELNMEEIYTFCIKAEDSIKKIKADFDKFYNEATRVQNLVLDSLKKSESTDLSGKYYYSTVLESYINEEGEKQDNTDDTSKVDINVPAPDNKENKNANIDKDVELKTDTQKSDDEQKDIENAEYKKVKDTADWYLNAINTINLAKITAFQKIYSEYMKILKYHVRKATGSMGSTSNFTEDDKKQVLQIVKDYKDAKSSKEQDAAKERLIELYRSRKVGIDMYQAKTIIEKNLKNIK